MRKNVIVFLLVTRVLSKENVSGFLKFYFNMGKKSKTDCEFSRVTFCEIPLKLADS